MAVRLPYLINFDFGTVEQPHCSCRRMPMVAATTWVRADGVETKLFLCWDCECVETVFSTEPPTVLH